MKLTPKDIITCFLLFASLVSSAQKQAGYDAIYSGIPWFDNEGNAVSAHGGCVVKDGKKFYLFGEKHTDTSNAFAGFTCYSSRDLYNWKFETIALPVQSSGKLGPNRVGERAKVMKCPKTGDYVMYMHVDTLGYRDQFVGYAVADNVTGPYAFKGPLLYNGKPIRKWDMGVFQDQDGAGYVLLHGGDIYRLSDDYKSVTGQVSTAFDRELEAPTLFRKDSIYYFLGSHLSSWEKNDNYYYTATALKGPWTKQGVFAPEGSLTWYSQVTFVLPIQGSSDTTYLFMGDRWSFPKQASAATYVWQPMVVSGRSLSIPAFREAWRVNTETGAAVSAGLPQPTISTVDKSRLWYSGNWRKDTLATVNCNEKDASFSLKFNGKRVGFYGVSRPDGGYARITIKNEKGKTVLSSIIDMYSKYPLPGLKFLSPVLPKAGYSFAVSVTGERGNWSDKRKTEYGSTGYFVSLEKIVIGH